MTEIYLIRHTQAEGNLYRMMQGHWDGNVTADGRRQVDALAQRFRDICIDALYSSDLYRARYTASAITRFHALPLNTTKLLREINMGPWETQFFANLAHEERDSIRAFIFDPDSWHIDGAESYAQVTERAYGELERIARTHEGQTVAVVSHGVTIRCILTRILGLKLSDTDKLPICRNTAVSRLIYENGVFTADYINDASHTDHLGERGWNSLEDLRDEPIDPRVEGEYYSACYKEAWLAAHGSTSGFSPEPYLRSAEEHYRRDKGAVLRMLSGDKPVGLVDMDTARGAREGTGWISLLYLIPEYRGKGYGVQLLARAIARYSKLGRTSLRLNVAEDNTAAIDFYRRFGFAQVDRDRSSGLLLMDYPLGRRER